MSGFLNIDKSDYSDPKKEVRYENGNCFSFKRLSMNYFLALVSTIGLILMFVIGGYHIVQAWGVVGLLPGIPILSALIVVAPLWLWWIGDSFPVVFTVVWAIGFIAGLNVKL